VFEFFRPEVFDPSPGSGFELRPVRRGACRGWFQIIEKPQINCIVFYLQKADNPLARASPGMRGFIVVYKWFCLPVIC